jgi:hypothetical protein
MVGTLLPKLFVLDPGTKEYRDRTVMVLLLFHVRSSVVNSSPLRIGMIKSIRIRCGIIVPAFIMLSAASGLIDCFML